MATNILAVVVDEVHALSSVPHFRISAFPHFPFLISPFLVLVQPPVAGPESGWFTRAGARDGVMTTANFVRAPQTHVIRPAPRCRQPLAGS